jgi:hypothetical protein
MSKNWRTFKKGDLVLVPGVGKENFTGGLLPAFVYEGQTMKNIIQIYAFGLFDEHSSSYVNESIKAKDPMSWLERCVLQGYSIEHVLEKMKQFSVEIPKEFLKQEEN